MHLCAVWSYNSCRTKLLIFQRTSSKSLKRVIFFRSKSEQPVSGRIGWNMCLIYTADGEGFHNAFVCPLAGMRVLIVEWTFMLIDHDSIVS